MDTQKKEDCEEIAFDLLREIVTRARNGQGYKKPLIKLKKMLKNAPKISKIIGDRLTQENIK